MLSVVLNYVTLHKNTQDAHLLFSSPHDTYVKEIDKIVWSARGLNVWKKFEITRRKLQKTKKTKGFPKSPLVVKQIWPSIRIKTRNIWINCSCCTGVAMHTVTKYKDNSWALHCCWISTGRWTHWLKTMSLPSNLTIYKTKLNVCFSFPDVWSAASCTPHYQSSFLP